MRKSKGFTLIELMIVVAIIGILSAIAIPKFADLIRKSNEGATKGNLGALRSAISIYYGEMEGWFPCPSAAATGTAANGLGSLLCMDNGKYMKEMPSCYLPPYHAKVTLVTTCAAKADSGSWGYCSVTSIAALQWGDLWVDCTATDSKNTGWVTY